MPASTPWYQGANVPLTWTSTDTFGNPYTATTVVVTITQPDGTTATPTPTTVGTGEYTATFTTAQVGHHLVAWTATSVSPPFADAFADTFEVQAAADPTIVSLAEAKEILHCQDTTQFDAIIQGYNAATTNWIEYACGPVVPQIITETIPSHGTITVLGHPPVIELVSWTEVPAELAGTGITVASPPSPMLRTRLYGIEWPMTQLYCDPRRGIVTHTSGLPFFYCAYIWQYQAGRQVIPAAIYEASKITLEHLFQVERGGTAAADLSAGESTTLLPGFGFAVPNRALQLIQPYSAPSRMVAA